MNDSTPSEMQVSAAGKVVSRIFRFLGGFAASVLVALVIAYGYFRIDDSRHVGGLTVAVSGAAASAHGAGTVMVRTDHVAARLGCREGCDDLRLESGRGAVMAVEVRDAYGRCLACAEPQGERPWRVRDVWTIGGPAGLRPVRSTMNEPGPRH